MATETTETVDLDLDAYIPEDADVETQSGSKSWRLANGKFVRGEETPEKSGNYPDERTSFTGRIKRVGIQKGFYTKDTKGGNKVERPIHRLEIDIETSSGIETIAWSLLNTDDELEPKTGTVRLAWAVAQLAGGEITLGNSKLILTPTTIVKLESWKGEDWEDDKGKPRTGSTYVSFYAVTPKLTADGSKIFDANGKPQFNVTKLQRPKVDDGTSRLDQWQELVPVLEQLPFYKLREMKSGSSHPTHLGELCKEMEAKKWPTPEQAPDEWLELAAKYFGHDKRGSLGAYDDDEWGEIRQVANGIADMPGILAPAAERLGKKETKGNAAAFA